MSVIPRATMPEHRIQLPILKKRISYRPFSVREEKILMLAAQSEDPVQIADAIKNVIHDCLLTDGVKVDDLSLGEIELLMVNLRCRSVGETVEININDPSINGKSYPVKIDLSALKLDVPSKFTTLLKLGDDIAVQMQLPGIEVMAQQVEPDSYDGLMSILALCIKSVCVGDENFSRLDVGDKEIIDWLEALSKAQFNQIQEFFESAPSLKYTSEVLRPDGTSFEFKLEGMADFFV